MLDDKVAIQCTDNYFYPQKSPYRPSIKYPEYNLLRLSSTENQVYEMVRKCFIDLELDTGNIGNENWNPLGQLIKKGDYVLLKPNLVMDYNPSGDGVDCLYTHPSVVAAVTDYVIKALNGEGTIIIGDAPMQECNFNKLTHESGYNDLIEYYKEVVGDNISISLEDFRGVNSVSNNGVYEYNTLSDKGTVVKFDYDSEFDGLSKEQFSNLRITNYDPTILKEHHNELLNEYYVSKWVLNANVIINLPKPKTHRKAGVTIAMKNLVGINARKEYLPHHTNGALSENGDCYKSHSKLKQIMNYCLDKKNYFSQTEKSYFKAQLFRTIVHFTGKIIEHSKNDPYFQGSWYGNDTISRTIVDLNKIIFFADKYGAMQEKQQRKYFIIADMIISGHKEGPVMPAAIQTGMIAAGFDPLIFDEIIAYLMGADISRIPTLKRARDYVGRYSFTPRDSKGTIVSNNKKWDGKNIFELDDNDLLYFIPTSGWIPVFKVRSDTKEEKNEK